ncbi:signal peptidase I [Paenibacillus sp. GCM10012307]|uniref:Signal peptidase I n=1 Tax=Paenibacillus roseus TaxID=2798579 RepID=A0A934MMI1_9BACL|nr:signal peptidase I [Paenibacillus roseus]MBJ6363355.1 signal peptidase I [Paenibacillus roseus]
MEQKPEEQVEQHNSGQSSDVSSGQPYSGASGSLGTPGQEATAPKPNKAKREAMEWIKALAIAALLVLVIRSFLFSPFIVDGPSMKPNFHTGERVIVNKILYDIRGPKRGEVVVFHVPQENRDFIKRVIGVPGDKVKLEGDDLYINGEKVEEPYLKGAIEQARKENRLYNMTENFPNSFVQSDVVPEGMFLAFGDNRSDSRDSRMIGYISTKELVGRADVIFWPLKDMQIIKHG